MTSRRRKFLYAAGSLLVVAALLLLASPLWIPWTLRPVLGKFGIQFASYSQTEKFLVLHQVSLVTNGMSFTAERVETLRPTSLLWRRYVTRPSIAQPTLTVSNWTFVVGPRDPRRPSQPVSLYQVLTNIDARLPRLENWVPRAELCNGFVQAKGATIRVPIVLWNNRVVQGTVISDKLKESLSIEAALITQGVKVAATATPSGAEAQLEIMARNPEAILVGSLSWLTNRIEINAAFSGTNFVPRDASLRAETFRIPAGLVRLEGYESIQGSFSGLWTNQTFSIRLGATATPQTQLPQLLSPFNLAIAASGTPERIRVDELRVASPWLDAELSTPTEFKPAGDLLSDSAELRVAADLSKQSMFRAQGILRGAATLKPERGEYPSAIVALSGSDLSAHGLEADTFRGRWEVKWPWVRLLDGQIQLKDGPSLHATARLNAAAQFIAEGRATISGKAPSHFLPKGVDYTDGEVVAEFSGPLARLNHSGNFRVKGLKLAGLRSANVEAHWQGKQAEIEAFSGVFACADSSFRLSAMGSAMATNVALTFSEFELTRSNHVVFALQNPWNIRAQRGGSGGANWRWNIDAGEFKGTAGTLAINTAGAWPEQGRIQLSAQELTTSAIDPFLQSPTVPVILHRFELNSTWTNGPLLGDVRAEVESLLRGEPVSASVAINASASGLTISNLSIVADSGRIVTAHGALPLRIQPGRPEGWINLDSRGPLSFTGSTVPNEALWSKVAKWTGVELLNPRFEFALQGTVAEPVGNITGTADAIELPVFRGRKIPRVTSLSARISMNQNRINLAPLDFLIEKQPVQVSAELPLDGDFSQPLKKVFDWRKASMRLRVDGASVAAFAGLAPELISPQGELNADVRLAPGLNLDGKILLKGAATRPLAPVGAVQDIEAELILAGHAVQIVSLQGLLGGELLRINGGFDLDRETKSGWPALRLQMNATNVPLARQAEIVLRSDLKLTVSNTNSDQAVVSGLVTLHDGFYLGDLKQLIPGKVASPARRPPYFSVETEPLADWKLDIKVVGDHFIKARSPLFRGELSANLQLLGTLREPLALGEARINSGVIQFPFANFRVTQGYISLTSENPYQPEMLVTAVSRSFGYDVKLDLTGPAEKPVVEFGSSPSLSSEQIIVMVTTGELPRDEIRFSSQQKATRLALFLGKSLISKFTAGEGSADRLTITSGENVSSRGRETYSLEYRLSDKWSIVGEYDRFSAVNAGIKWRLYSK